MARPAAPLFHRYVGIDYSGSKTSRDGLKGLRVYQAEGAVKPEEVLPPAGAGRHWCRAYLTAWLIKTLASGPPTLVGLDHAFSFPMKYFEKYGLAEGDWPGFLADFQAHWPTDRAEVSVAAVRKGQYGDAAARGGDAKWRRLCERRSRAKSVFHFDVPGAVATSTHAGLPWLLHLRSRLGGRVHFWPFDGWSLPEGRSVVAEVYPSLWRHAFAPGERTSDQHDAYAAAAWPAEADRYGYLADFFTPELGPEEHHLSRSEGWILGVR